MMKKILVIEDEAQTRDILVESLEAEGFDTICAENGRVGVKKAQEYLPDLVICDILMPELDGYGVLITLRQNFLTAKIPLIFLTAKTTDVERCYGMNLGANAYVTKPCTVEALLAAIAKVYQLCTVLK
ncbi:response regulator transcription factor [Nostoc sp. C117]|uniref:response regulator transcription factor n=1 Tax=Nostoc sp. C117 TaxID=3349875 RepID=UPI00370D7593